MASFTNPRSLLKITAVGVVGAIAFWFWPPSAESLLKQARTAELNGELRLALDLAAQATRQDPQSVEAVLLAASIANHTGNFTQEIHFYRQPKLHLMV